MPEREVALSLFRLKMELKQNVEMETVTDYGPTPKIAIELLWDLHICRDGVG